MLQTAMPPRSVRTTTLRKRSGEDEAFNHGEAEIARIVWGLRRKIELEQGEPQLLQTVRGLGYRLATRPYSAGRQVNSTRDG